MSNEELSELDTSGDEHNIVYHKEITEEDRKRFQDLYRRSGNGKTQFLPEGMTYNADPEWQAILAGKEVSGTDGTMEAQPKPFSFNGTWDEPATLHGTISFKTEEPIKLPLRDRIERYGFISIVSLTYIFLAAVGVYLISNLLLPDLGSSLKLTFGNSVGLTCLAYIFGVPSYYVRQFIDETRDA